MVLAQEIGPKRVRVNVVLFFASELSAAVTGQWIRVNAGRV